MKMTFAFALLFAASSLFSQTPLLQKTIIHDEAAAKKILGVHKFALDHISGKDLRGAGAARIVTEDSVYKIKGIQKVIAKVRGISHKEGAPEYITIAGTIRMIEKDMIVIDGTIVTRVRNTHDGEPCARNGTFTFKQSPEHRNILVLEDKQNPCTGASEHIYLFLTSGK